MSVKVMGRVWDAALDPNLKLVLMAYADAAEHDGTEIWPGWERLVKMTGYSRTQVQRITNELKSLGVLEQVGRGFRGRRAAYRIPLDHPLLTVSHNEPQSDDSDASEADSDASDPPIVTHSYAPPPVLDPSLTPGDAISATIPKNPDETWTAYLRRVSGLSDVS